MSDATRCPQCGEVTTLPIREMSLESVERLHILAVLEHHGHVRRKAAVQLGIARSTLLAKLRKYGIPDGAQIGAAKEG